MTGQSRTKSRAVKILAALTANMAATACGNPSQNAAPPVPSVDKMTITPKAAKPIPNKPQGEVEQGRCYMNSCSWWITQSKSVERQSKGATLWKLSLLGGTSDHKNGRYPSNSTKAKITWNDTPHTTHVLCAPSLPAVINDDMQVDVLDFVNGPPGILESSVILYEAVCHPSENSADDGFVSKHGYVIPTDEEITIRSPQDIFRWVKSPTATAKRDRGLSATTVVSIPSTYWGAWAPSAEECNEIRYKAGGVWNTHPSETRIEIYKNGYSGFEVNVKVLRPLPTTMGVHKFDGQDDYFGEAYPTQVILQMKGSTLRLNGENYIRCPAKSK